jgi:hypothetical protein
VRRLVLFAVVFLLAGCGGSKHDAVTTTGPPALTGVGHVLYQGSEWAVAVQGAKATAYRLTGNRWVADRGGEPKIDILGPKPGQTVAAIPQVAFQVTGKTDIADTAMWVDGVEVPGKGGGLTPKRGTIYGAPGKPLKPGTHVAVAYGRTAVHATAVAWTFHT